MKTQYADTKRGKGGTPIIQNKERKPWSWDQMRDRGDRVVLDNARPRKWNGLTGTVVHLQCYAIVVELDDGRTVRVKSSAVSLIK